MRHTIHHSMEQFPIILHLNFHANKRHSWAVCAQMQGRIKTQLGLMLQPILCLFSPLLLCHWRRHGVANGGSCPPPQLSPDRVLRLSQNRWEIFWERGGGGGKDNLHENIYQNCIQISWKCSRRRLAAGLRPDPLGELKRSPRLPSRNEETYL